MGVNQRAQIEMTDTEIAEFLEHSRVVTMATNGSNGTPHVIAMWYGLIDGELDPNASVRKLPEVWFETKAKSQKVANLRRDNRISCMIEDGDTYDTLRGVSIEGHAEIIDDYDALFRVAVSVWERYTAPYTEECKPLVEELMRKRVAVRVRPERIRSWDHRKLGIPPMPIGGTTAAFLPGNRGEQ